MTDKEIFMKQSKRSTYQLNNAKRNKKDEFYTQLSDIENELKYYRKHFKNKVVYLNCDDSESNFFKYFTMYFDVLGLKKVIATYYDDKKPTYKLEVSRNIYKDGKYDESGIIKTRLRGNGDFKNAENIELLKEADIVVTNPPFSLFIDHLTQIMEYNKKFIVIGNITAVGYNALFPWIYEGKIWTGVGFNISMTFRIPNNYEKYTFKDEEGNKYSKLGGIAWYTNLEHNKYKESFIETVAKESYDPKKYPKYDNYDAIDVDQVKNIPYDYYGEMGVPITFLGKYNPDEFEIIALGKGKGANTFKPTKYYPKALYYNKSHLLKNVKAELNNVVVLKINAPIFGKSYYQIGDNYYRVPFTRLIIKRRK